MDDLKRIYTGFWNNMSLTMMKTWTNYMHIQTRTGLCKHTVLSDHTFMYLGNTRH